MHHARQEADKKVYENIDPKSSEIYCLDNQFRRKNADVVGDKLGPVVQSIVSLTSSLRVISLTVLADSIYNILIFFAEKM